MRAVVSQRRLHYTSLVFERKSVSACVPIVGVLHRTRIGRGTHAGAWSRTPHTACGCVDVARGVRRLWKLAVGVPIAGAEYRVVQRVPVDIRNPSSLSSGVGWCSAKFSRAHALYSVPPPIYAKPDASDSTVRSMGKRLMSGLDSSNGKGGTYVAGDSVMLSMSEGTRLTRGGPGVAPADRA